MFKNINKSRTENINVIYKSDETTRRAIDSLYVSKRNRTKAVIAATVISLLLGLVAGTLIGTKVLSKAIDNKTTVRIETAESLKARSQTNK